MPQVPVKSHHIWHDSIVSVPTYCCHTAAPPHGELCGIAPRAELGELMHIHMPTIHLNQQLGFHPPACFVLLRSPSATTDGINLINKYGGWRIKSSLKKETMQHQFLFHLKVIYSLATTKRLRSLSHCVSFPLVLLLGEKIKRTAKL